MSTTPRWRALVEVVRAGWQSCLNTFGHRDVKMSAATSSSTRASARRRAARDREPAGMSVQLLFPSGYYKMSTPSGHCPSGHWSSDVAVGTPRLRSGRALAVSHRVNALCSTWEPAGMSVQFLCPSGYCRMSTPSGHCPSGHWSSDVAVGTPRLRSGRALAVSHRVNSALWCSRAAAARLDCATAAQAAPTT